MLVPTHTTWPSFFDFYETILSINESVGAGVRVASRLIPKTQFMGADNLAALGAGIMKASAGGGPDPFALEIQIIVNTPVNVPDAHRATSVTPVWRSSLGTRQ